MSQDLTEHLSFFSPECIFDNVSGSQSDSMMLTNLYAPSVNPSTVDNTSLN